MTQERFADALSMSAVAADRGYPMLFVEESLIPGATCAWFSGHPEIDLVHVAGGDAAVDNDLPDRLREECGEADLAFERHAGADRVDTSLVIARRFFDTPTHAALATAGNWPDAVLGGNLASAYIAPVLLSFDDPDGQLGPAVEAYLRDDMSSTGEALILGGVAALTDEFEAAVEEVLQ